MKNIVHINSIVQFIKFGIVGLTNTVVGFFIYYILLFYGINYLLANILSWAISVMNSFYWNNKYVFLNSQEKIIKVIFKTYVSYALSFFLNIIALYILVSQFNISKIIAPILVLLITIPLNFFLNKFWAFR